MSMQTLPQKAAPYRVRAARPADVPALMRLKWQLAVAEDATFVVRAGAIDWLRDGFGPDARFVAIVAEAAGAVVGMATCSERYVTGWVGPTILLQDLIVDAEHRRRGIARALLAHVALLARERGSPLVELTVRADNPAQNFYLQSGFIPVLHCRAYVLAQPALTQLAEIVPLERTG
jgi:ribosomal protein S18 acetylase RimI-like enzyme